MSIDRFIELLQALITMTDPNNEDQVMNARNILKNLLELAGSSGMADRETERAMLLALRSFTHILHTKEDFAGTPGDVYGNRTKRLRLKMMLRPNC